MQKSVRLGAAVGGLSGGVIGAGMGAIVAALDGVLAGSIAGLVLGAAAGALTAALTVKTAGTTGGIGVGYFTGMLFGGVFGVLVGAFIPASWRMSARAGLPALDVLTAGRFETAMHAGFLFSILSAIVGTWIGGTNQAPLPRQPKGRPRERIDQFDLVEVIEVPEPYKGVISIGDIGVVVEKHDEESFEVEYLNPGGSYRWTGTLSIQYVRLKQKIPDNL